METNCIIDLSHHNRVSSFHEVTSAGIKAAILKADQGVHGVDPKFKEYSKRATDAGLLLGAYHFGNGEDPVKQFEHFMNDVGHGLLLAIDCETPSAGGSLMTPAEAESFVAHVHAQTGIWPLFYTGQDYIHEHFKKKTAKDFPNIAQCSPWPARYGPHEPDLLHTPWDGKPWSLWQYTSKAQIPGIQGNVDRNWLHAGIEHLSEFWAAHTYK